MENNLDSTVAMTIIVLAILFMIAFFGVALLKDLFAKKILLPKNFNHESAKQYAKNDLAFTQEAYSAIVTKPATMTFYNGHESPPKDQPFFYGDFDFCNGAPVYNDLASQYNRKHA